MSYVINIYRKPKPGNFKAVRDATIASLDASVAARGGRGFVTGTMSHPMPTQGSNMIVSATGGFETADEIDEMMDSGNDEVLDRIEAVNALCDSASTSISQILPPQSNIPENFNPKWVMRDMQIAKPGQLPGLIEYLMEWREQGIEVRNNLVLTIPLGKMNLNALRLTFMFESLADMETGWSNIVADPKLPPLLDKLETSPVRVVSRVLHRAGF
ncbi:MAG: hypothetical protein VYB13_01375 [Chloroflexota bacterium]|nr:hypothetical protein [Chloroflexota bacterium]MED6295896.1 hypothetical protein [Chloroflexota bacterium]|tara:strand:+ start:911 stop:1552 length:642 start_codon:yes stop_codon:yes gene_type:complete